MMRPSLLQFLRRIVLNPNIRPAAYAQEFGISRSAVHQTINSLKIDYDFHIRGRPEYSRLGLIVIFGWAQANSITSAITNFAKWLSVHPNVYSVARSVLSSNGDFRVYFEALLRLDSIQSLHQNDHALIQQDRAVSHFLSQLARFRKKPYLLDIRSAILQSESMHINLAMFDGSIWTVKHALRLRAILNAMRQYTAVLPSTEQENFHCSGNLISIQDLILIAGLTSDYYVTSMKIFKVFKSLNIKPLSTRTIRRRLAAFRNRLVHPYVHVSNVGLSRRFIISIYDEDRPESAHRIFHAQAEMFPQCRVLSGGNAIVLDLRLPYSVTVPQFSSALSDLSQGSTQICAFETQDWPRGKALEEVLTNIIRTRPNT